MPTTVHIPTTLLESIDRRAKALGVSRTALQERFDLDAILVTADVDRMTRIPGLRVEDWSR